MRIAKLIGALLVACLVIAAVASAASAGEFLVRDGNFPQSFTGSGTNSSVFTNTSSGNNIECPSILVRGTLNSSKDALVLLLWHKCFTVVAGSQVPCTTSGESSGLVRAIALALPVIIKLKSGLLSSGLLLQAHPGETLLASYSCSIVSVEVKGTVLFNITSPGEGMPGVFGHSMLMNAETEGSGTSSKQVYTATEESAGPFELESSESKGTFHKFTVAVTGVSFEFTSAGVEATIHK